jgi:methionine sulfoxide reductase heme-binding subunit
LSGRVAHRLLKPVVFVASLVPLALMARAALTGGLGANPIEEAEIRTGLWTLRFVAFTLAITPLRRALHWNALIRVRRMVGLFAFFYGTIHLSMWVGVDMFFDFGDMAHDLVKHRFIYVGMATWLTFVPLAITSTRGWIRRLGGRRWNRLHQLVYLTAIGGTTHYLWAVKKDTYHPLVYFALFAVLLGWRVVVRLRARAAAPVRSRASSTAAPAPGPTAV